MGWFRKKSDPLAQRARTLNRKIAELEAEIARLNQNQGASGGGARPGGTPESGVAAARGDADRGAAAPRSKSLPGGANSGREQGMGSGGEPVYERISPRPVEPARSGEPGGGEAMALGLKRPAWSQWWRRLKAQFVDPPPANEKLVNYLAAGGIHGLRPLRFERRIARNRIVFVCVVLGLLLWGLLVMFRHTR